jgi:hypothetical protein
LTLLRQEEEEYEEEDEPVEEGDEKFLCEGVKAVNLVAGPGIPTQAELFEGLNCQAGAMVSRKQLSEDLTTLLSCVSHHLRSHHPASSTIGEGW